MQILVSPEDEHLLSAEAWRVDGRGYVVARGGPRLIQLHVLIAAPMAGQEVDHRNGNKLDNRRGNLRVCTHADNMKNRKRHSNNALGVKGVYPKGNRFVAQIRADGVKHRLGSFESLEMAAAAYRDASTRLHGAFARPT